MGFIMLLIGSVFVAGLYGYRMDNVVKDAYYKVAKALYWALRGNHESTNWGFGPNIRGNKGKGYTRGY